MVFYRKYRPQIIDDLDSTLVRETLTAILQKNTPHAFLFTGPKGLGKTSTARIIAKAINCTGKKEGQIEPCNQCEQCLSIINNTNVDILEIDAASNRGIDEIRDLKEKIRLAPVAAKKKVYIIDEVHMLTTEAFNALLKTLEEPPSHAMFILCTTEPQKIPSTILSRCFHISFHLATPDELVRSFKRIVTSEQAAVADDALVMIAELADGGFRDGVKLLEETISLANGQEVTKKFIEDKFNVTTIALSVENFIKSLHKKDVQAGIAIIAKLVERGIDIKYFLQKVTESLHTQLLQLVGGKTSQQNADKYTELLTLFRLLSRAYSEMKYAILPQLPLELALLEWCGKMTSGDEAVMSTEITVSSLRKQVGAMQRLKALYGDSAVPAPVKNAEVTVETTTVELMKTTGEDGAVTKEWLDHLWKNLIHEIKNHNHTVAGLLRGCTIKSYSKELLIIETAYKFHKERLDEMKTREALLNACKLLTGNTMEIRVELRQ